MKPHLLLSRMSFFALLVALPLGCGAAVAPGSQAVTEPPATPSSTAVQSPSRDATAPSKEAPDTTLSHGPDAPPDVAPAVSAEPHAGAAPTPERAAYERAKPVFDKHCAKCHTSGGAASSAKALEHFAMDGYPFGGHHAAEIGVTVRKSIGAAGSKATMPRGNPGAVQGDELAMILAWANAFDAAHPPAAKSHGSHGH